MFVFGMGDVINIALKPQQNFWGFIRHAFISNQKGKHLVELKNFKLGLVYCCSKAYNLMFGFGSPLCVVLHAVPVQSLPTPATRRVETKKLRCLALFMCVMYAFICLAPTGFDRKSH